MQSFKIFAFLSFSLAIAWGQSGTVKSEGQPIPGATVRATQGDRALITVTDANGTFTLDKMTPGTWTVDVDMFGFEASPAATSLPSAASDLAIIHFNWLCHPARAEFVHYSVTGGKPM